MQSSDPQLRKTNLWSTNRKFKPQSWHNGSWAWSDSIGNCRSWLGTWSQFYRRLWSSRGLTWSCSASCFQIHLCVALSMCFTGLLTLDFPKAYHSRGHSVYAHKIFEWKKKQRMQWRIFNRTQYFIGKGDLRFMELCDLAHLTYPSCDFISLIYKMGANYTPCNSANRMKWRHCEKALVLV